MLTILHVLVCLFLIAVILLQSGKAGDISAVFGGMGSQTFFGPRGATTLLAKATTVAAVIFMFTSIGLGILRVKYAGVGETVLEVAAPQQQTAPVTPGSQQEGTGTGQQSGPQQQQTGQPPQQ